MPACVIVSSSRQNGELDAVICAPGTNGPDRTSAVPVKVKLVSEQVLSVDGQPHEIIPTTGGDDGNIIYLINFSMLHLRNRTRRTALAQASVQLQRLRTYLLPIRAESERPQLNTILRNSPSSPDQSRVNRREQFA